MITYIIIMLVISLFLSAAHTEFIKNNNDNSNSNSSNNNNNNNNNNNKTQEILRR